MNILIKGIKMPESCYECSGFFNKADYHQCYYDKDDRDLDELNVYATRPEWCPLVEIPTPHGRLIDERELRRLIKNSCYTVLTNELIDQCKTIVEAEE